MHFRQKNGHKLYYFNINTFSLLSLSPPLLQTAAFNHYKVALSFFPSPAIFHSVRRERQVGGRRDSWGHNGTASVAKQSQSPGCRRVTCWGNSQSPQRWKHPSCRGCRFLVTCEGTAPLTRASPIRVFHPPSCSLMVGALQRRCCYPSLPNACDQVFPSHLPLRAACQDVLKLGNK